MRPGRIWAILAPFIVAVRAASSPTSDSDVLATLPTCATDCMTSSIKTSSCAATNTTCLCEDAPLLERLTLCVEISCTVEQALFTKNVTSSALCHEPIRDRSDLLYYTAAILAAVTGSFVVTRFAIRIYLGFRLGYDDWTTLATTALGAGSTVLDCVYLKRNGIGKDIWTLTPHQINRFGALFYASQNIYFVLVSMQKLIFIFFYLQIFPRTNIRYILWGTLGLNCIIGFVYTITSIFECTPISFYWEKWDGLHHGHCVDENALARSNAIINILMDFWIIGIPLWEIRNLNLTMKKKMGVVVMLCLGTVVTVFSVIRLTVLFRHGSSVNPTWDFSPIHLWSILEINVGIIGSCLPSIRLLLVHFLSWMQDTVTSRSGSTLKYADQSAAGRSRQSRTDEHGSHGPGHFSLSEVSAYSKKKGADAQESYLYPTDEEGLVPKGIMVTRGVEISRSDSM